MIEVTERVLCFAQQSFEQTMRLFLRDPSKLFQLSGNGDAGKMLAAYRRLADDLGLDFEELLASGAPHEQQRLRMIEGGMICTNDAHPDTKMAGFRRPLDS